jgi:hypothetical protein
MRPSRLRPIAIALAVATLLPTIGVGPASALTLQRSWSAHLGTSGVNGALAVRAYTNGVGQVTYDLKRLRANATYSVAIRYGTCSRLGSTATRLPNIRTSSTGIVHRTDVLYPWTIEAFWKAARTSSFVVRIVSGTSIRCQAFYFVHATRVAITSLNINLPVMRGPSGYPYCRVAMYQASVAQPREPGITFIYAHARTGMFLPILTAWKRTAGRSLIGKTVKVYTSDSRINYYRIVSVRKTTNPMAGVTTLSRERLWLQTSTGPNYTYPKLIVEAVRYAVVKTTYAASHPTPHPIRC